MSVVENIHANGAQQSVSANYGLLGGYRMFFNKRSGVELSYGYTHNKQANCPESGPIGVRSSFEGVFVAFVFQLPAKRRPPIVIPSVVICDPSTVRGVGTQTQGRHLYDSVSDFSPIHRTFPRTAHRAVFYNSETFNMYGMNGLDRFTNREEPAVKVGYTF
jgi:hypothetical protein